VLGTTAGIAQCLGGCSSSTAPANVDFTLDLSASENAVLRTVGGFLRTNGVIVACVAQDTYIAVQSSCTHEGATLSWQQNNNRFHCPEHGATFSRSGAVTNGPARDKLVSYTTTLNGTMLRVTS